MICGLRLLDPAYIWLRKMKKEKWRSELYIVESVNIRPCERFSQAAIFHLIPKKKTSFKLK